MRKHVIQPDICCTGDLRFENIKKHRSLIMLLSEHQGEAQAVFASIGTAAMSHSQYVCRVTLTSMIFYCMYFHWLVCSWDVTHFISHARCLLWVSVQYIAVYIKFRFQCFTTNVDTRFWIASCKMITVHSITMNLINFAWFYIAQIVPLSFQAAIAHKPRQVRLGELHAPVVTEWSPACLHK